MAGSTIAGAIAPEAEANRVAARPAKGMLNAVALLRGAVPKVPDIRNILARRQARVEGIKRDSLAHVDGGSWKTEVDDRLRH